MKSRFIFYLKDGVVYYDDKKNLRFVAVKNPDIFVSYVSMDPDEVDTYKEIDASSNALHYRTAPEKLLRILTDMGTVMYLTEESFINIFKQVNNYLSEIEDYERMCIIRDVQEYFKLQNSRKKAEIEDYIKHHNKAKK
jgi:hypothetical protein